MERPSAEAVLGLRRDPGRWERGRAVLRGGPVSFGGRVKAPPRVPRVGHFRVE